MSRSRSSRETMQDLELRLGLSSQSLGCEPTANCLRSCPELIVIDDDDDDDDDDVQLYHPVSFMGKTWFTLPLYPPICPGEAFWFGPYSCPWVAIREEDLELRLGNGASNRHMRSSNSGAINLERFRGPNAWKSGKASCSQFMSKSSEVKFRCAICMDMMKEETSTTCGHVFCKACITNAIRVQKRCPICREKLCLSNIHRIYLPGVTS